jgi:hypothetical protein
MQYLTRFLLTLLLFVIFFQTGSYVVLSGGPSEKCTGADPCHACKNCKYCKHCARDHGTCGVCKNKG